MLAALRLLVAASGASWKQDAVRAEAAMGTMAKVSDLLKSFMVFLIPAVPKDFMTLIANSSRSGIF